MRSAFVYGICIATLLRVLPATSPGEISATDLGPVPLGIFEATGRADNYARYHSSLMFEFKELAAKGVLGGKPVMHSFSRAPDGQNNSYIHSFRNDNSTRELKIKFNLGSEIVVIYNVTSLKYAYWYEPGQGLHADYNMPPENPMQIQQLFRVDPDGDGFELVYKLGDVIGRQWYKRANATTAASVKSTTAASSVTAKKKT